MATTLVFKEKYRKMEVACPTCGAEGEWGNGNGECVYCGTKACYMRHFSTCANYPVRGSYSFPCFKAPICEALAAKNPDWRKVKPLEEVPYQVFTPK